MQLYFAPMEGITGSVYRQAHHRIFGGLDRYYAPFIFTNPKGKLGKRDRMEIGPEYNRGFQLVPQLLSNCAPDFIAAARVLQSMGYGEVNLNLGCPSATVISKGRGAGFLGDLEGLDRFLDEIFEALPDMKISLKTRIGLHREEEFDALLEIYGRYPVAELIVHPRLRQDFYGGAPNLAAFDKAVRYMTAGGEQGPVASVGLGCYTRTVCYNGNLFTVGDLTAMRKRYPQIDHWMLGRGLLSNPALAREIRGGRAASREEIADFYHELLAGYEERLQGSKKVIHLMKEFWQFIRRSLSEEDQPALDRLMRTNEKAAFLSLADEIAGNCRVMPGRGYQSAAGC